MTDTPSQFEEKAQEQKPEWRCSPGERPERRTPMTREEWAEDIAIGISKDVAELPDRSSPDNWPDAMLVTHDELRMICSRAISSALEAAYQEGLKDENERCAKIFDRHAAETLRKGLSKNNAVSLQNWQHAAFVIRKTSPDV